MALHNTADKKKLRNTRPGRETRGQLPAHVIVIHTTNTGHQHQRSHCNNNSNPNGTCECRRESHVHTHHTVVSRLCGHKRELVKPNASKPRVRQGLGLRNAMRARARGRGGGGRTTTPQEKGSQHGSKCTLHGMGAITVQPSPKAQPGKTPHGYWGRHAMALHDPILLSSSALQVHTWLTD